METMFYEIRPWAFVAIGAYAMFNSMGAQQAPGLFFFGAMLAFASSTIIYARSQNRNRSARR